jgi:hypothetical protein
MTRKYTLVGTATSLSNRTLEDNSSYWRKGRHQPPKVPRKGPAGEKLQRLSEMVKVFVTPTVAATLRSLMKQEGRTRRSGRRPVLTLTAIERSK